MEILILILSVYGISNILVYGKIFSWLRTLMEKIHMGGLINCIMCTSFHVGWIMATLLYDPIVQTFNVDETNILFVIGYKIIGGGMLSGTTWFINEMESK